MSSVVSRLSARRTPCVTTMTRETPGGSSKQTHSTRRKSAQNGPQNQEDKQTHTRTHTPCVYLSRNTQCKHTFTNTDTHRLHSHTYIPINQNTVLPTAPKYSIGITRTKSTAYISLGLNSLPAILTFSPLFLTETNHHTAIHSASAMSSVGLVMLWERGDEWVGCKGDLVPVEAYTTVDVTQTNQSNNVLKQLLQRCIDTVQRHKHIPTCTQVH